MSQEPDRETTPADGGQALTEAAIDAILTAQIAVAWAGETGEEPRLGWWRSDLVSEFGGEDLFKRLLPHTWQWAVLQAVREAARRHDAALRAKDHDPDRLLTVFYLGFEVDERIDQRLQDLKQAGDAPTTALPDLASVLQTTWDQSRFSAWVESHDAEADHVAAPVGRRLKGTAPSAPEAMVSQLVAALLPLGQEYSLPHFRRET